jgi:hypothetical protein
VEILPVFSLRPKLLGESRVYDLLSRVPMAQGFAVHSVNLPEHQYKRWAEADFVLVNRTGVTLLEVKGGTVTLAGREWRYENSRGQAIRSTEGPARQALTAAIALEELLRQHLHKKVRVRWGVVFPLCSFRRELAELPPERLADVRTCESDEQFESWLNAIPFDQYTAEEFALEDHEIGAIRDVLVPEFSASMSLGLAVKATRQEIFRLTDQQFSILESLDSNERLLVTGGAGTGKTELAAMCARAEKAAGRSPVIATPKGPLAVALADRMTRYDIPVTSDELPRGTDVLIVDEGQDFVQPGTMEALFAQLPGGASGGRWRWFMDPNLQYSARAPDANRLKLLERESTIVRLARNVRSTVEIVGVIKSLLQADVGISRIDGFGVKVKFIRSTDKIQGIAAVESEIHDLLEEGISPSEIALLGPNGVTGQTCQKLLEKRPDVFKRLSQGGRIQSASHGIVCSIREFRGLEARVVILVDMDDLPDESIGESLLYIGMSRASAVLEMLVTPGFGGRLESLVKRKD